MILEGLFVFWVLHGSHLNTYVTTFQPKNCTGDHLHTHNESFRGWKVFLDLSLPMQRNFPNSSISVSLPHKENVLLSSMFPVTYSTHLLPLSFLQKHKKASSAPFSSCLSLKEDKKLWTVYQTSFFSDVYLHCS